MIEYLENQDLFDIKVDALINPVNCKGAMGKGIARAFKKKYPEYFKIYKEACVSGKLVPGVLIYIKTTVQPDKFSLSLPGVILFPTKDHWKYPSKLEWIEKGLLFLKNHYQEWDIHSIAMPQIGCGLGGLKWDEVKKLIESLFQNEAVDIYVCLNSIYTYNEKTMNINSFCKN